ncbi:hypothetical protein L210DRAFT_2127145 [Boletus edulis BED1]|uniref:Protein kinase domain-containing protein n=1 Tax=Boletus edulis BED1 TaxID=1328754 RepID=A0AAD4GFA4_BOLED|nr:hypothetical protein L210DRAFT_2127145 [Boletus edulis BED1]
MANTTTSTPQQSQSQILPPDTRPVERFTSQSDYLTGDLSLARQAVLKDLRRYLQVPYTTLIRSAFGAPADAPADISRIRQKLTEHHILKTEGAKSQWVGFAAPPTRSNVSEDVIFRQLTDVISSILDQIPNCIVSFMTTQWFNLVVPFQFKKTKDRSAKRDNEQKIIWRLRQIMREDPFRRFAMGITIEDTDMRFWYSSRAFLAASEPINFMTDIDDVISLFYSIGSGNREALGWDPTVERIRIGNEVQYKFKIGNRFYTTTRPLATYGADAMVGCGTRVYEALNEEGNLVVIKDSWRDDDREPEGMILERILKDIQDKIGEEEMAEAEKYFVKILAYEDVFVSGKVDKTFKLEEEGNIHFKWIAIDDDPFLSTTRYLPSTGHIPSSEHPPPELARCEVRPPSTVLPRRVHTRTVFKEVGIPLTQLTGLVDGLNCLHDTARALYYVHKAGYVHRDFSVNNVLWFEGDGRGIGKLTDFEYAKKVGAEESHDIRTGTMHFMAGEVEAQRYIFMPEPDPATVDGDLDSPPFRMNFLHDLESHWWCSMWFLLYHTDANSPTKSPKEQLKCFNQAFPRVMAHTSRHYFFTLWRELSAARATLSTSYQDKCLAIFKLSIALRRCYHTAEEKFPDLVLDDSLLDKAHKSVRDTYVEVVEELVGSQIQLKPVRKCQEMKRNVDDSPPHRAEKRKCEEMERNVDDSPPHPAEKKARRA